MTFGMQAHQHFLYTIFGVAGTESALGKTIPDHFPQ
jgi:hypothetical protein